VIRVGYNEDKLPFAYFNVQDELVGFDVNMAHALARDLGVRIEFVRFARPTLAEQLAQDHFEVVIPSGPKVSLPLFYAIGGDDAAMRDFLEHWFDLREKDGTMASGREGQAAGCAITANQLACAGAAFPHRNSPLGC
jgi:ABC-type amino acid transport substrate-binding protein